MMDRQFVRNAIIKWLKANALGRENAKPRLQLLMWLIDYGFLGIGDRTMRRIYSDIMMVGYSCRPPRGIYWITDPKDLAEFKRGQQSKAIGTFSRMKLTEQKVESQSQGNLF